MSRFSGSTALVAAACMAAVFVSSADAGDPRDFDFNLGVWKTHVSRLDRPLSHSTKQLQYDGVSVVSEVWNGRASLIELDVQGPAGRIQGVGLRLYNPRSGQWNLNWASGSDGVLSPPMIGEFKGGRGEFFDHEVFAGRAILARNSFSEIGAASSRFEQAFSADGGRTWEPNWVMTFERTRQPPALAAVPDDASHDFDFDVGTWNLRASRLRNPLTGSTSWDQLDGKVAVRRIWGGRANLAEVTARGETGEIELLSLRLYNPQTRQWTMHFASSDHGTLSTPMIGEFKDGRGEFYSVEPYKDRTILVRFVLMAQTAGSARSEQAFSADGGKTWEINWVNDCTRSR